MTEADDADRRHAEKMARRKQVQDAEVASKTIASKGLLMVNTGPGKGKSTASFGLVLRALGHGWRVGVVQFVKGAWHTGERTALERFSRSGRMAHDGRGLYLGDPGSPARHRGRWPGVGHGAKADG